MNHNISNEPRPKARFSPFWYFFGRRIVRAFLRLCYGLESLNLQNIPAAGGAIFVINHASFFDIPVVGCTSTRSVRFVGRESLDRSLLFGWYMRRAGVLYIRRDSADVSALRQMVDAADAGDIVAIYPEGTRTSDGRMQTLRPGVLLAARRANVPLIPVGIVGTFDAFSRHRKFPRLRGKIIVSYGEPFRLSKSSGEEQLTKIGEAIAGEVERAGRYYESKSGRKYPYL